MAIVVQRIEKDLLLKTLYEKRVPVVYLKDQIEYALYLQKPVDEEMYFRADRRIFTLNVKDTLDLVFDYWGKVITFNVEVLSVNNLDITCTVPASLYKNLDRAYSRVSIPKQMQIQFNFLGDHYKLSFPKVTEYHSIDLGDLIQHTDPKDISGLIEQMSSYIKNYADGYKLVIFKDTKPSTMEERVITQTGKALYLPSTLRGFPHDDPYPTKRMITENMFKQYLESTGVDHALVNNACERFIREKADSGIIADGWFPILFREYVIGYIHTWVSVDGLCPFDYPMVETLFQFTKVLAYSLKINGYFEQGKVKNNPFGGNVIDISASGLLFAYPHSDFSSSLLPESKLMLEITTPQRTITTQAIIVRRFNDKSLGYYGCHFKEMEEEDFRYLFKYIYGKPFTDFDAVFLSGQV